MKKSRPVKSNQTAEELELGHSSSRPGTASKTKTLEQMAKMNNNIERLIDCTREQQHQIEVVTASVGRLENGVKSLFERIEYISSPSYSTSFDHRREVY